MSEQTEVIDLSAKTVTELKQECKDRDLPTTGKKQDLIERLEEYMKEHEGAEITEDDLLEEPDVSLGDEGQEPDSAESKAIEAEVTGEPEVENPAEPEKEVVKETEPVNEPEVQKETASEKAAKLKAEKEEMERKKLERAKKFGIESKEVEKDKKKSRAERFGLNNGSSGTTTTDTAAVEANGNKKKSRAERFGLTINAKRKAKLEGMDVGADAEKLKKRAERFGKSVASTTASVKATGDSEVDQKKAARAARFAAA